MKRFQAADVMSKEVVTVQPVARVSDLVAMLTSCTHNGFPVVADGEEGKPRMVGMVLRSDIITLLQVRHPQPPTQPKPPTTNHRNNNHNRNRNRNHYHYPQRRPQLPFGALLALASACG